MSSGEASDEGGSPRPQSGDAEAEEPQRPPLTEEQQQERDNLLHWWILNQLPLYLRRLAKCPESEPFRQPLPWEELGLLDYPEVVQKPMDLETVSKTLEGDGYLDADGLVNPEFFWEDVGLCWDNCMRYYEGEEEAETYKMAVGMRMLSSQLEEEFWSELGHFENSLGQLEDPTLRSVATMTDVAARTVEEAAAMAYHEGSAVAKDVLDRVVKWWWGERKRSRTPERRRASGIALQARKPLRDQFRELLEQQLHYDAVEDISHIEGAVLDAFDASWPRFEDDEDTDVRTPRRRRSSGAATTAAGRWATCRALMLDGGVPAG